MAGNENQFGLKKPEPVPPVTVHNTPFQLVVCGDLMYMAFPLKNIWIPIEEGYRHRPKELIKAEAKRMKFEEDLKKYNEDSKQLTAEYRAELEKEMKKEMSKAQEQAAKNAQKSVANKFKKRMGL